MSEKKNFDSDFCGSLPIHHINLIQDYGSLIVLDSEHLHIVQTSENISDVVGISAREVVGQHIGQFIDVPAMDYLKSLLSKKKANRISANLNFNAKGEPKLFHVLIHVKEDYLVMELELAHRELRTFTDVFQEVKNVVIAIEQAATVQEVSEVAIQELRKLSGFDGVLMYQFDEDWNGTVIAEEKDERLESYIGQTFPASDIPRQARQLYLKNPYRLIPNRAFTPIRLYPVMNPITKGFIDLSDCNLRSVPGVHLEYMKNMGINASMSIRVIHDEQLWGLISCHHIEEKYLSYEICSVFEWLSAVISNRISFLLNKQDFQYSRALHDSKSLLGELIHNEGNITAALLRSDALLKLFKAGGAAMMIGGKVNTIGHVPDKDSIDNLLLWLEGKNNGKVFHTNHLPGIFEEAHEYADVASGLLMIPLSYQGPELLICFRPEVVRDINWGGDPHHAINFEVDKKTYHPRNSFKLWKQRVEAHSLPWNSQELDVAEALRIFLYEFRTKQLHN